jgi:hypothetical protein
VYVVPLESLQVSVPVSLLEANWYVTEMVTSEPAPGLNDVVDVATPVAAVTSLEVVAT